MSELTFQVMLKYVADMVTVDDRTLLDAMFYLWERLKLIVEPTAALGAAADDYLIVAVDQAQLPGFSSSVDLFEILARRRDATDEQQHFAQLFSAAREAFRQGRGDDALEHLRQLPQAMQQRPYVQSLVQACASPPEIEA